MATQESSSLDLGGAIGKTIADQVLSASSESAKNIVSTYGRIDILRPYFNVETKDVTARFSVLPQLSYG